MKEFLTGIFYISFLLSFSPNIRAQRIIGTDPCNDSLYIAFIGEGKAIERYYSKTTYHQAVSDYLKENSNFEYNPFNWRESKELPVYIQITPNSNLKLIVKSKKLNKEIIVKYSRVTFDIVDFDPQDLYNPYEIVIADSFGLRDKYLAGFPAMPWGAPNLKLDSISFWGLDSRQIGHIDVSKLQKELFMINPDISFTGWTYPRAFISDENVIVLYIFGAPHNTYFLSSDNKGFAPYLFRIMFNTSAPQKSTAHIVPGRLIRRYGFAFKKCFENAFF